MTNPNHVSAQDISTKWSKVTQTEAASIKNTDSLSAQVQKSYGFDKAKADAEVKEFMGARTF
jgi:hypothetical protein